MMLSCSEVVHISSKIIFPKNRLKNLVTDSPQMLHCTGFDCLLNAFFAINLAASDDSTQLTSILEKKNDNLGCYRGGLFWVVFNNFFVSSLRIVIPNPYFIMIDEMNS
ncbi:hypothetical protein BpHYR1_049474 [Brachionus plicatilis]|uniref:Uncharacterized protein n=1 Tax=Brachionus plicatilis TaxID=10195 RepID=A0A3M7REJ1_BRAPC|nr:hypothetical protein BpHYR1_049474 [Brachionus plicatilis]